MLQESESLTLLAGVAVLLWMLFSAGHLKRLPASRTLMAGFCVLFAGWALTVLEGFLNGGLLNLLEHACYSASAVLLAVWCVMVFGPAGGQTRDLRRHN